MSMHVLRLDVQCAGLCSDTAHPRTFMGKSGVSLSSIWILHRLLCLLRCSNTNDGLNTLDVILIHFYLSMFCYRNPHCQHYGILRSILRCPILRLRPCRWLWVFRYWRKLRPWLGVWQSWLWLRRAWRRLRRSQLRLWGWRPGFRRQHKLSRARHPGRNHPSTHQPDPCSRGCPSATCLHRHHPRTHPLC